MKPKTLILTAAGLVVLIVATTVAKHVLLGGLSVVSLAPAPPLTGAISQGLGGSGSNHALLVPDKDYTLQQVQYFDNKTWAVASVALTQNGSAANPATLVLRQQAGSYQVVLGPGTAFTTADVQNVPQDVISYMKSQGVLIYATTSVQ